jgi:hypothetical protein
LRGYNTAAQLWWKKLEPEEKEYLRGSKESLLATEVLQLWMNERGLKAE